MGLHVQQVGQGPDVALVHGWAFNGRVWRELVASLMQDFRVTVVDLPGHGRSPEMPGAYTMETLAQQVLALFQRPVTWVGWSLGAMVGLAAACLPHTAIARMVLIGATPRFARGPDWAHGLAPAQLREFAEALERDCRGTLVRFLSLHLGQEREGIVEQVQHGGDRDQMRRPVLEGQGLARQVGHGQRGLRAAVVERARVLDHRRRHVVAVEPRARHAPAQLLEEQAGPAAEVDHDVADSVPGVEEREADHTQQQ